MSSGQIREIRVIAFRSALGLSLLFSQLSCGGRWTRARRCFDGLGLNRAPAAHDYPGVKASSHSG